MTRSKLFTLSIFLLTAFTTASAFDEPLWRRVLRFLGAGSTSESQKGAKERALAGNNVAGNIHLYNVETKVGSLVKAGSFRSPIFLADNDSLLALSGEQIVKIVISTGEMSQLRTVPGVQKLDGIAADSPDHVLLLRDLDGDNCPAVAVVTLSSCQLEVLPYAGEDDLTALAYLKDWNRQYDSGDTRLEIKPKTKTLNGNTVEWTDVWLKLKNKDSVNVSRCDGSNCGQPAVSADRKFVLFIRSP